MNNETKYRTHPATEMFPPVEANDLKELADDIRQNGLREPITRCDGMIIDGRSRLLACNKAGVEPIFCELPAGESPAKYAWSKNYHRRHLTVGQRLAAAGKFNELVAKEAKRRMSRGGTLAVRKGMEIIPPHEKGPTRDKLAAMVGTNPHYISDFGMIQREAPDLADEIVAGNVTIPEAKRRLKGGKETESDEAAAEPISIFATLLVVDLAIGSEDRHRRNDILRAVVAEMFARQACDSPAVITINEHYREGVVQSFMPCHAAARLEESWSELEARTRIISCRAFPLKCRRVKPKSVLSGIDCESHAISLKTGIEKAIQRLAQKGETDRTGCGNTTKDIEPISAAGATRATA